ncbi:LuxR C-terminal-related transcriptional regulator [uncultured Bosea sp.]|uniref:response regulator transcription factor n=1 Tax=uncultured Bosea sp. TaxID=211457 RepID=UPI0025CC3F6A|nr:LuxR C-terminal-related transcriptional regulator [uncultured Bosea sp.]
MNESNSQYRKPPGDIERPRPYPTWNEALQNRHAIAPERPPGKFGRKAMLHVTIEADDISILGAIRAVLPEGSRLHVRFANNAACALGCETGEDKAFIRLPELTARQRDIMGLLVEGLSNKGIGRKLSLSHFTVRNHISQIMRQLNASTRKEVIARVTGSKLDPIPGTGFAAKSE